MNIDTRSSKLKRCVFYFTIFLLIFDMVGCDAFVRKFTRKRKKENMPQEEMVLAPEEYKPSMGKEEMYRQYFVFWKSWQDELTETLLTGQSHKRQVDCAEQALKNLTQLRELLKPEKQKNMDNYIRQLIDLRGAVLKDVYGSNKDNNRSAAEMLKRRIMREFSYDKVKGYLI